VHVVAQLVAFAQAKPPGHGVDAPPAQVPAPLHVPPEVSSPLLHDVAPHRVPLPAYLHAPNVSQSVAPQVPPVTHDVEQQRLPVPKGPQIMLAHASALVHGAPAPPRGTHLPDAPGVWQ
jgi:hypothetical protein